MPGDRHRNIAQENDGVDSYGKENLYIPVPTIFWIQLSKINCNKGIPWEESLKHKKHVYASFNMDCEDEWVMFYFYDWTILVSYTILKNQGRKTQLWRLEMIASGAIWVLPENNVFK